MSKKNLTRIIGASLFGVASLLTNVKPAIAGGNSASQIVTIRIDPIRALYLDEQSNITKILSNCDTPTFESRIPVVFQGKAKIPMNNEVWSQYSLLLSKMDLNKPGLYEVTPDILQYFLSGTPYSALEKTFIDALGGKNSPDTYDKVIDTIKELKPELDLMTENSKLVLTIINGTDSSVDFSAEVITK